MSLAVRAFTRNLTDRLIRDGAPYGSLETRETLWLIRTSSIHLLPRQFAIAAKISRNRRFRRRKQSTWRNAFLRRYLTPAFKYPLPTGNRTWDYKAGIRSYRLKRGRRVMADNEHLKPNIFQ